MLPFCNTASPGWTKSNFALPDSIIWSRKETRRCRNQDLIAVLGRPALAVSSFEPIALVATISESAFSRKLAGIWNLTSGAVVTCRQSGRMDRRTLRPCASRTKKGASEICFPMLLICLCAISLMGHAMGRQPLLRLRHRHRRLLRLQLRDVERGGSDCTDH